MKFRLTLALLAVLHLAVVLAAWIAPYDYAEQHRDYPFAPPSRLHFRDAAGRFHLRPFVYGIAQDSAARRLPRRPRARLSGAISLRAAGSSAWLRRASCTCGAAMALAATFSHACSTAAGFRCSPAWSRRSSRSRLGSFCGTLAGFHGGWVDSLLMRGGGALPGASLAVSAARRARLPAAAHFHRRRRFSCWWRSSARWAGCGPRASFAAWC